MKTHYDKKVDAMYISFQNGNGKVSKTLPLNDFLLIDLDKDGRVSGIEILDVSAHLPKKHSSSKRKK